jgi:hypothetical protein
MLMTHRSRALRWLLPLLSMLFFVGAWSPPEVEAQGRRSSASSSRGGHSAQSRTRSRVTTTRSRHAQTRRVTHARRHHTRTYYSRGYHVRTLPRYRSVYYGGSTYYYSDGYYYRPASYGGYVVVGAPVGLTVSALPLGYTRVVYGGSDYYVWGDTCYTWSPAHRAYVVVDRPAELVIVDQAPEEIEVESEDRPVDFERNDAWQKEASAPSPSAATLVFYPSQGQSDVQRDRDRYECHIWSVRESRFDPSQGQPAQDAAQADHYGRSLRACMQGRGYAAQ